MISAVRLLQTQCLITQTGVGRWELLAADESFWAIIEAVNHRTLYTPAA